MNFFKDTKAYKFVTLVEQLEIEHRYLNIIKYLFKLFRFNYEEQLKTKKKVSIEDKIKYMTELFKERYYLEGLKGQYDIKKTSAMDNNIINNIIISELVFDTIKIYVEYGLMDNRSSIYVVRNMDNKGINLTKADLNNEINYDMCINAIDILHYEIMLILGDILLDTIDRMRRVRKNV